MIALQVFWKLLCLTMAGAMAYAAVDCHNSTGKVFLFAYSAFYVLVGVCTSLGDR